MKVTHLCTSGWRGGASRAAARLHAHLRQLAVESTLLVQEAGPALEATVLAGPPPWLRAALWRLLEGQAIHGNRSALSNTFFSAPVPGGELAGVPAVERADVLHLHWIAHFLTPASLAALARTRVPVVWTLHDQRPLTGGCHFSAGCRGYESACAPCPQLRCDPWQLPASVLAWQRAALPAGRVVVVSPSRWLAECARRSALFADSRIEVIPNGVDAATFAPLNRATARAELGLPAEGFFILFGADHGMELRKGAAQLAVALGDLARSVRGSELPRLLCFGHPAPVLEESGLPFHRLGYLESDAALRRAYSAADVMVIPSLEDNLPNTLLESLSCGTPVIAFRIGGLPDVIVDGRNGRLVPAGDSQALALAVGDLLQDRAQCAALGVEGARTIRQGFTLRHQAERCLALYHSLPASTPAPVRAREMGAAVAARFALTAARAALHRLASRSRQ